RPPVAGVRGRRLRDLFLHVAATTATSRSWQASVRLPSSLDRLAVGSIADAVDLYAHSVLPQADPAKNAY
ncbi:hypothetical protein BHE74_00031318, partial [Ensete ventricosum]